MPPETSETAETTEAPEATESLEATEAAEVTEAAGAAETAETTEAAETTESLEATETAEAAENAEAAAIPEAESPEAAETAEASQRAEASESTEANGPRRGLRGPALLGAAAIILGSFGVWASLAAHSLRDTAAGLNVALTDRAATSAVRRETSQAINTIFSYSYADTARTKSAAQHLLTGTAIRQYDRLFSLVQQRAPAEKLVVTTRVVSSGVELLTGDRARLLIFANQQDTRAGTSQTSYAGTMFAITAVRQDGSWKIESIDTFTGHAGS